MKSPKTNARPAFEPAETDIQKHAYLLWKEEGSPSGRDLDFWLRAKELVRHHAASPRPGRPAPSRRPAR